MFFLVAILLFDNNNVCLANVTKDNLSTVMEENMRVKQNNSHTNFQLLSVLIHKHMTDFKTTKIFNREPCYYNRIIKEVSKVTKTVTTLL